ncbi:MAG: fibronectin type III domain-containing protein, partial [Terracidiphilus sp.]
MAVFTEPVSGGQNESCQFTVPVGVPLSCTPILAGAYGDHRPAWRFPAFVYDVPAGIAPVVSGNLTAYGNTLNGTDTGTPGRYVPVFDFFWVELAWPVPAAPTGLTATPVSSTVVDLAWTNPAGPLTGNNVTEWAGSGCTGGPLDTFAMAPGTVAVRGSLAVGTTYSYSVTASNVSGVGANSACADATTFDSPPAPTDLVATPYNTTQIDLTWVNPVGPLDDLNVTTYAGSGCVYGDDITNAILGVITAYDWIGLVPNSPYSFTVNAENSTGWSAPSDCASATTPPVPPTLTVANVTFYSFNESWTAGNWTNVTGAYLVLTFNASICGSVVWGDTTNSYWTWAVYTGGGEVN